MEERSRTRISDDPQTSRRIRRARREGRKFTILWAAIVAGIVSLFIGRAIEVQIQNDQVKRSRINCNFTQDDRKDRIDTLLEAAAASGHQADQTLGNPKPLVYKIKKGDPYGKLVVTKKAIPPADFNKPPFDTFKAFKPFALAQAQQQRASQKRNIARAEKVKKRLENCNKVFPKKKTFYVF